ncbi:MAG: nitrous oxide reductase accessory protein NosL [Cyanobacteriota bacterium]
MKKISRILIVIISIVMGIAYALPLWKIYLIAPQYPEGLSMKIGISSISGDLGTINGLNHYIGMKTIEVNSIKELFYMPYILAYMIIFGFFVAFKNKFSILLIWFSSITLIGILGLLDFYNWTYDYGNNLDPHAAIKIPGMSYQPPVIGTKQLLNFTASSYPDAGGIAIIIAGFLIFAIVLFEFFNRNKANKIPNLKLQVLTAFLSFSLFSCTGETKPIDIEYGKDQCTQCKMTIMDKKYGAEIITKKGKVFKFDSIECTANYYNSNKEEQEKIKTLLVTNFSKAPEFIDVTKAYFLHSKNLPSPMGGNFTGFADIKEVEKIKKEKHGKILDWNQIIDLVKKK